MYKYAIMTIFITIMLELSLYLRTHQRLSSPSPRPSTWTAATRCSFGIMVSRPVEAHFSLSVSAAEQPSVASGVAANSASLAAMDFALFSALTLLSQSWAGGFLDDAASSAWRNCTPVC